MTAEIVNCEQCNRPLPDASAVYSSTSWKLLCPTCLAAVKRAAQRKTLAMIGMSGVLLIIVGAAMFAAGLGKELGYTLIGLGFLGAMSGWMVIRAAHLRSPLRSRLALEFVSDDTPEETERLFIYVLLVGLVLLAVGGFIVNAS